VIRIWRRKSVRALGERSVEARWAALDSLERRVRILETIDLRREMEGDPGIGRCVEDKIVGEALSSVLRATFTT